MKQWLLTIHLHVKRDCWNQRQMLQRGIRSVSQNTLINKCKQCSGTLKNKTNTYKTKQNTKTNKAKTKYCSQSKANKKQTKSKGDQGKKHTVTFTNETMKHFSFLLKQNCATMVVWVCEWEAGCSVIASVTCECVVIIATK